MGGRSAVLAACLAIDRFHVSGEAALGFFRIMRPGAITCPKQERFLKSLKTADDVRRFANLPMADSDDCRLSRMNSKGLAGSVGLVRSLFGRCSSAVVLLLLAAAS